MASSPRISLTTLDGVPVLAGETTIDILRLPLIPVSTQELPVLDIVKEVEHATQDTFVMCFITAIQHFLDRFYFVYINSLTETLFDMLAWRFMHMALKQSPNDEESNVSKVFLLKLAERAVDDRPWTFVQKCVRMAYKFNEISPSVTRLLGSLSSKSDEDVSTFVNRTKILIQVVDAHLWGQFLVDRIYYALPDRGQDRALAEFGSRKAIPSHEVFLDFISESPTILEGDHFDPVAFYASIAELIREGADPFQPIYDIGDKARKALKHLESGTEGLDRSR